MGYLKIYLNIWILKKKNFFRWIGEPTHLTHQPVMGWARLQNFWLTRKWVGLGSFIFNPARGESTRVNRVGSLWHVYYSYPYLINVKNMSKRRRVQVTSTRAGLFVISTWYLFDVVTTSITKMTWLHQIRQNRD